MPKYKVGDLISHKTKPDLLVKIIEVALPNHYKCELLHVDEPFEFGSITTEYIEYVDEYACWPNPNHPYFIKKQFDTDLRKVLE